MTNTINSPGSNRQTRYWSWLLSLLLICLAFSLLPAEVAQAADGMTASSVQGRISPVGHLNTEGQLMIERAAPADEAVASAEDAVAAMAAPTPVRSDYPDVGVSSRAIVWILAQLHLFFAALVLAVPLFVLTIELVGLATGDERYDDMAHEFMKISLTGFSITAIFGGSLALALFLLYPDFMGYMMHVFGAQWLVYAGLFFLESFFLYTYYYGWNAFRYGNLKWVHLSLGLMLNASGRQWKAQAMM